MDIHTHITPDDEDTLVKPNITDFDQFLPWACKQHSIETDVVVNRTALSESTICFQYQYTYITSRLNSLIVHPQFASYDFVKVPFNRG